MDIFTGFIAALGFNFPPRNWTQCAGQILAISDNTALYSLLSTYYGGDARVTYGIPELRGRAPIGYGTSPGQPTYPIGFRYGQVTQALTIAELPSHTHTAVVTGGGTGAPADVQVSTNPGISKAPAAGDCLASGDVGSRADAQIYIPEASAAPTVSLGGVSGGGGGGTPVVTNTNTGLGTDFSILQPILAINYSMVFQGIYPPRN